MSDLTAQPLQLAQALLGHYQCLVQASDCESLSAKLVASASQLSGSDLCQLYQLDATHTRLGLVAEQRLEQLQAPQLTSVAVDYQHEQLLQFSLCQGRVLVLEELNDCLYDTSFLPAHADGWRSLLCVPLRNGDDQVCGLLLLATLRSCLLSGYAEALAQLGALAVSQSVLLQRLRVRSREPLTDTSACAHGYGLIGSSARMGKVCQMIGKVLHSPYTVLLTGETGTGKEVVARAIHDYGPRRSRNFVVQNCAAFAENLLESELFGYRKGAFTGADRDHRGLFDLADGGTLLLDEIGDMPLTLQAKILRVLQEGEIRPLGDSNTHKVDVRIIASTHRNLVERVADGRFREDLYYRLAQFPLELPPLRQREGDIETLARHFSEKACRFLQREPLYWSEAALDALARHAFAGNVRELKGIVERAVLLCEGEDLLPEHFDLGIASAVHGEHFNLRQRLEQTERGLLLECLRATAGNRTLAARKLGVSRRTLLYRMRHLNIEPDESAS
jgi:sigma-54-dependent transcriptional regulator